MSTDKPTPLHQFLCLIPDLPNAPRLQVRPAHMEGAITSVLNRDFIVMGGAYLTHHPPPPADGSALADEDIPFAGSAMVVVAASEDEVLRRIRDDPYAKRGVWDVDRARIWSYKTVFAAPPHPAAVFATTEKPDTGAAAHAQ